MLDPKSVAYKEMLVISWNNCMCVAVGDHPSHMCSGPMLVALNYVCYFSWFTGQNLHYICTIYKENSIFQLYWAGFFFPKTSSIFNTNNTCLHYICTIYKENSIFQLYWAGFFFPKTSSIFNTNNTCNK